MPKFRKKPVVIEAVQWNVPGDHPSVELDLKGETFADERYIIKTLEGWMTVTPGDWIITGVKGEQYPCKPDIFAATYESPDAAPGAGEAGALREIAAEFDAWKGPQRREPKGRCDNWFVTGPCGRDEIGGGQCGACLLDRVEDITRAALAPGGRPRCETCGGGVARSTWVTWRVASA